MKCEWSRRGYCEYYSTAEEQEEREREKPTGPAMGPMRK